MATIEDPEDSQGAARTRESGEPGRTATDVRGTPARCWTRRCDRQRHRRYLIVVSNQVLTWPSSGPQKYGSMVW